MSLWRRLQGRSAKEKSNNMSLIEGDQQSQELLKEIARELDQSNPAEPTIAASLTKAPLLIAPRGVVPRGGRQEESSTNIVLENGICLEGALYLSDGAVVQGKHVGKIFGKGRTLLGETAEVDGEVYGRIIEVRGSFKGSLIAEELVKISRDAVVKGSIATPDIEVEPGAVIESQLQMSGS